MNKGKVSINLYLVNWISFLESRHQYYINLFSSEKIILKIQTWKHVFIIFIKLIHFLEVKIWFWQHQITPLCFSPWHLLIYFLWGQKEREAWDLFKPKVLQSIMFFRVSETHMTLIDSLGLLSTNTK